MKKIFSIFLLTFLMMVPARADIPAIPGIGPSVSSPWDLVPLIGIMAAGGVFIGIVITVVVVIISKKKSNKK